MWVRICLCAWLALGGVALRGQEKASAEAVFEVATVKPAAPSTDGHTHIVYPPDGSFSASNITLLALMEWAYGMPTRQILDGPGWMGSTRFDMQAKSDAETDARLRGMSGEDGRDLKRLMVQRLLEERFGMKVHRETRVLPAYDLVVAKGGLKMLVTKSNGKSIGTGGSHFTGEGLPVGVVADELSKITGRVVVDKTGLDGRYDFKLVWTPDNAPVEEGGAPSLFTAVQEQLGLRLEAAKEAVPVIVVDGVRAASEN